MTEKKPRLCRIPKTNPPTNRVVKTTTVGKTSQITLRSLTLPLRAPILVLKSEVGAVMVFLVTAPTPLLIDFFLSLVLPS